ncbi:unnamed protein product [Cyprideis torosa]|uniref:Uncharacterized protein n=1 Tax=Cyprideis torosa TaxID=163714 RepID=A0A7R8WBU3_9CRUS|nr:unnamed protein product [Cyprideis torosa]CAG0892645.1 unnamed protein product [Cyprideis torosa]
MHCGGIFQIPNILFLDLLFSVLWLSNSVVAWTFEDLHSGHEGTKFERRHLRPFQDPTLGFYPDMEGQRFEQKYTRYVNHEGIPIEQGSSDVPAVLPLLVPPYPTLHPLVRDYYRKEIAHMDPSQAEKKYSNPLASLVAMEKNNVGKDTGQQGQNAYTLPTHVLQPPAPLPYAPEWQLPSPTQPLEHFYVDDLILECSATHMSVDLLFGNNFYGVIYPLGHDYDSCPVYTGTGEKVARFPLERILPCDNINPSALPKGSFKHTLVIQWVPSRSSTLDMELNLLCEMSKDFTRQISSPVSKPRPVLEAEDRIEDPSIWIYYAKGASPEGKPFLGTGEPGELVTAAVVVEVENVEEYDATLISCVASNGEDNTASQQSLQVIDRDCSARPHIFSDVSKKYFPNGLQDQGTPLRLLSFTFPYPDASERLGIQCDVRVCLGGCPPSPPCKSSPPPNSGGSSSWFFHEALGPVEYLNPSSNPSSNMVVKRFVRSLPETGDGGPGLRSFRGGEPPYIGSGNDAGILYDDVIRRTHPSKRVTSGEDSNADRERHESQRSPKNLWKPKEADHALLKNPPEYSEVVTQPVDVEWEGPNKDKPQGWTTMAVIAIVCFSGFAVLLVLIYLQTSNTWRSLQRMGQRKASI